MCVCVQAMQQDTQEEKPARITKQREMQISLITELFNDPVAFAMRDNHWPTTDEREQKPDKDACTRRCRSIKYFPPGSQENEENQVTLQGLLVSQGQHEYFENWRLLVKSGQILQGGLIKYKDRTGKLEFVQKQLCIREMDASGGGSGGALKVGTEVYARNRDGCWYPALVSALIADKYRVDWQDGDTEDTVFTPSPPLPARLTLSPLSLSLALSLSHSLSLSFARFLSLPACLSPALSLSFHSSLLCSLSPVLSLLSPSPLSDFMPPPRRPYSRSPSLSRSRACSLSLSLFLPRAFVLNTPRHTYYIHIGLCICIPPLEPLTSIHAHTHARRSS
jgi:hypothetical protein